MKKLRCLLVWISVCVLVGLAGLNYAGAEHAAWDCPECGRLGNTRNYCGGCAHPAPWLETATFETATAEHEVWDCPECGQTGITKNYCGNCAHPAPWMETESEQEEKIRPQNEFFPNGKLKKEFEFNDAGNVSKTTFYNRYGVITSYYVAEEWDANGNITRQTEVYPNNTGKYRSYNYIYSYDERGNEISWSYTYADGSAGHRGTAEYDSKDHVLTRSGWNEKGEISYIHKNFQYDTEDHVISYASFNAEGVLQYNYHAVFENGIRVESTETDSAGKITEKYTYDPTYGDNLSSSYAGSDGARYESFWRYYSDYYEEDWRSLKYGNRTVTQYSAADGNVIKEEGYIRENTSSEWVYDSTSKYFVNQAGNSVKDTTYADGSTYRRIQDENGNIIYSKSINADGSFFYAYSHEYDSQGRNIRSTRLTEEGNTDTFTLYDYDNQDRQILSTTYKADGSFDHSYEYIYDSKGNIVRENRLDENGRTKSYYCYEYDDNGNYTYRGSFRADGTKSHEVYYRTLSDGTEQHKYLWYNSDGSLREEEDWE